MDLTGRLGCWRVEMEGLSGTEGWNETDWKVGMELTGRFEWN
jgi:hypothetical protein